MRLANKIALVTGGASGIGAAIARRFDDEGARVIVTDINLSHAQELVQELNRGEAIQVDVSSSGSVQALFDVIAKQYGWLDILVNSAGIMGTPDEVDRWNSQIEAMIDSTQAGKTPDPWDFTPHITDSSWQRMLEIHLTGTFYMTRASLNLMSEGASIINIASIGAVCGDPGVPHYSAAKAGMCGLTRSIASEVAPRGIRVNAILPGPIITPMTESLSPPMLQSMISRIPMGRRGRAEEIAGTAFFLASEDSSYFTGQQLSPNGGIWM